MKSRLIFDVTDANTIAETDSVGAYVRAGSDGDLIASQTINSEEWLNTASVLYDDAGAVINAANPLSVSITDGVNVEVDLSHLDDSVRLGDGTSFFTSTSENGDISLDVHISNSDLDIRDLDATQDSVESWLHDGTGTAITSTGGAIDVNIASGTVTVTDAALADTAIATAVNTLGVASTAEDLVASPLASRKYLLAYNNDNRTMFIGQSGVTSANGFPIDPGAYVQLRAGASIDIEYVSPKVGHETRTLELS